jgi:hypothetical protein
MVRVLQCHGMASLGSVKEKLKDFVEKFSLEISWKSEL